MSNHFNNNEKLFYDPLAEAMFMDAANFFFDGKVEKAFKVFGELNAKFPKFYPGLAAHGDILLHAGLPALALEPLRKAVRLVAHEGRGFFLLGVAYLQVGRFHHAARAFDTANALLSEEERDETRAYLGRVKIMLGEIEEGQRLIQEALKKDISNAFFHTDMAQSFVQIAEFDEALKWCESSLALAPGHKFILDNIRHIKKFRSEFLKMSPVKREARRKLVRTKLYQEQMRIECLLDQLKYSLITPEDFTEVKEELKMNGITGRLNMFSDMLFRAKGRRKHAVKSVHGKRACRNRTLEARA